MFRFYCRAHAALLRGAVTVGPDERKIALTFDDGPDERWTPGICSMLAERGARASFFMIGSSVEKAPELAREVADAGHSPCVHLFSHDRRVADDDALFEQELQKSIRLIDDKTGQRPAFMRFPFAYLGRQKPDSVFRKFGVRTVHWSFSSMDSRLDAERIVRRVGRRMFPGAIVLLHDGVGSFSKLSRNRDATLEALPKILDMCKRRGLEPVALDELLGSSEKDG
jgi:peptidoglycan/xylan/chitin deacetylase (PgdA/CDA1 family)